MKQSLRRGGLRRPALMAACVALLCACEDKVVDEEAPIEPSPALPALGDGPGHWAKAQRGLIIDDDDLPIVNAGSVGVTGADLAERFGLLVIARPYVDSLNTRCTSPSLAAEAQPRRAAERVIAELKADDPALSWDRVAVNVDLLSPDRSAVLDVCFEQGGDSDDPRFDNLEHRAAIVAAFEDLAGLPDLAYVTVGLDMNQYFHLRLDDTVRHDDYTNFVTLYREVYRAIKAVNAEVQVGPGISWSVLRTLTAPEVAAAQELDPDGLDALLAASRLTVQPLLTDGRGGAKTADFLAISMIPAHTQAPWNGSPGTDDASRGPLLEWLRPLSLVSGELPVVVPVMDWAEVGAGGKKGQYLITLKAALSNVNVAWAAWRRLSDVPIEPASNPPCAKYTARPAPLNYPTAYCTSGMFNASGDPNQRGVYAELTTDP